MDDKELKCLQRIADGLARQVERKVYIVEHFDRIETISEKELTSLYSNHSEPKCLYTAFAGDTGGMSDTTLGAGVRP